jgi:hypothetical protein
LSTFAGVGFYSGKAERAGSQRGRNSLRRIDPRGHDQDWAPASFASPEETVRALIAALEQTDDAALATLFEKDLGGDTASAADAIETFDPDSSWAIVGSEKNG